MATILRRAFSGSAAAAAKEVVCKRLPPSFCVDTLFEFNKTHGSTPHNFIPDEPVREHLGKLPTGETVVWGAFLQDELVGFISAGVGSEYWHQINGTGAEGKGAFIHEFVVHPDVRGHRIGAKLTQASVDPTDGIFSPEVAGGKIEEIYTTVHVDNVASRTAFVKSRYSEVVTYLDAARDRATTVLKCTREEAEAAAAAREEGSNDLNMRVVGLQSGNAVDGIDVGIFDITLKDGLLDEGDAKLDLNKLAGRLSYKTLANKTYSFTEEERAFVLKLRALRCEDGNDYALANYRLGRMFADRVERLLEEAGVDKSSVDLIGSHGQTISGHPHWELGDLSVIAVNTGITTAGDFRPADVAAGGNGTPCTCTYDSVMLRPDGQDTEDAWRVAINVGGTSSVTFCPPRAGPQASTLPHGLDPGLGVFFMDLATADIDPTLPYDDEGRIARSGKIHEGLVEEMMQWRYYKQTELPIGVGPDDFPQELFRKWRTRAIDELGLSKEDFLATLTDHSTKQIVVACRRFGGEHVVDRPLHDVVVRGGVTNNKFWMERLRAHLADQLNEDVDGLRIRTLDDIGLEEETWENAMYAIFGFLCRNGYANFAPSCTGATRTVVGGKVASAAGCDFPRP